MVNDRLHDLVPFFLVQPLCVVNLEAVSDTFTAGFIWEKPEAIVSMNCVTGVVSHPLLFVGFLWTRSTISIRKEFLCSFETRYQVFAKRASVSAKL